MCGPFDGFPTARINRTLYPYLKARPRRGCRERATHQQHACAQLLTANFSRAARVTQCRAAIQPVIGS